MQPSSGFRKKLEAAGEIFDLGISRRSGSAALLRRIRILCIATLALGGVGVPALVQFWRNGPPSPALAVLCAIFAGAMLAIALCGASFVIGQRRAERQLERANRDLSREAAHFQLLMHAAVSAHGATSFDAALRESVERIFATLGGSAERESIRERLQQSQKMEAVGQLAAGLAHEISNPMSYVRSNLHSLQQEWDSLRSKLHADERGPDRAEHRFADCEDLIQESLEGVERTISIVRDMKELSHSGGGDRSRWQSADLSELLEGAFRVTRAHASGSIRFEHSHGDVPACHCSPNQLRQVFVNLIVNAIQAIALTKRPGRIRLTTDFEDGHAVARVQDDGPGISEETRQRLFDPFFTTKPVGEGTGLGLSVSYEIVRVHGGEIRVHSEPGAGATFEVRLPIGPAHDDLADLQDLRESGNDDGSDTAA